MRWLRLFTHYLQEDNKGYPPPNSSLQKVFTDECSKTSAWHAPFQ
ncbi:hypothetical protein HMPREF0454_03908 [Hafnia alvei ATCC 51873]|uniref:Uncharacterized protein n=1 Tax=Hafnia alvei ATCC 51873 TaxID=1002364 RepID=G9YBC9_HAFAL|nr:hypothetical protein HMPREF0454_03908 [Hafnia alvei ATCC 51873]